jgi:hypothetical protein
MKKIEITTCHKLDVTFSSTEGLNKFTEFMFRNNIKGMGFEKSIKNSIYTGFFTDKEIKKIKEHFNYEQ